MLFLEIKIKEEILKKKEKQTSQEFHPCGVCSTTTTTQAVLRTTINFPANEDNKEVSPRGVTRTHAPQGVTGGSIPVRGREGRRRKRAQERKEVEEQEQTSVEEGEGGTGEWKYFSPYRVSAGRENRRASAARTNDTPLAMREGNDVCL